MMNSRILIDQKAEDYWNFYYPKKEFYLSSSEIDNIILLLDLLNDEALPSLKNIENYYVIPIDWLYLTKILPVDIKENIIKNPEEYITYLAFAIHLILYHRQLGDLISDHKITLRIENLDNITPIKEIKANCIGNLISIKGVVVRVGPIKPLGVVSSFKCKHCETINNYNLQDGKHGIPKKCTGIGCKSKMFTINYNDGVLENSQIIKIQEQINKKEPGRVPRLIECQVTADLINKCAPGDVVIVCGVVKTTNSENNKINRGSSKELLVSYIDTISIALEKQSNQDETEFTKSHLKAIKEISKEENIFGLLVNSICPSIYGHQMVKAGIILTMFGGCPKYTPTQHKIPIRSDCHLLIVGDPGLGKSQMLTSINNITSRGVYICGSNSTTTGLTVSLIKEVGSGDYSIEAGALVLSDKGICCIDEFDKMVPEYAALMEAMEQQRISIAKAGIVATLPARTSVIAAANPQSGHYDKSLTASENLNIGSALLSRFDLTFILIDNPNEKRDRLLSEHVMKTHGISHDISSTTEENIEDENEIQVLSKLKIKTKELLPQILIRKYISYARQYVHPTLTPEACSLIMNYYLTIRDNHKESHNVCVTVRQLESIIRLSEARAKLELREDVTESDVWDVIDIMNDSILQSSSVSSLDFRRKRRKTVNPEEIMQDELKNSVENNNSDKFTSSQLYEIMTRLNFQNHKKIIDNLNERGILLKQGGYYKFNKSAIEV